MFTKYECRRTDHVHVRFRTRDNGERLIDRCIVAGERVRISINNRYNTYYFGGDKYVVFSEHGWIGGKNNFLGILFIVLGALSFLIAISFFFA